MNRISRICIVCILLKVSVAGPLATNETDYERSKINMRSRADMTDWVRNVVADALQEGSNRIRNKEDLRYGIVKDPNRGHLQGGGRFTGGACNCKELVCTCCSHLHVFGLDNRTCTQLTYDPVSSSVHMHVKTQNHYHISTFPVSQAKTRCFPIRAPYMQDRDFLEMCVGFYNVTEPHEGLLHLCMAANGRLNKHSIVTLYYDCMNMGAGLASSRPPHNVPGSWDDMFPVTSPAPPSGEVPWAPPKKIPKGKYYNGSYATSGEFENPVIIGLAKFLATWLF
ncbi:hypothetical protein NE865_07851 [Phthorimaea operculella]|nr:hypothetical protein NE865_07851 [Phthorimaea operculella]